MRGSAAPIAVTVLVMSASACVDTDVELLQVCGGLCGCLAPTSAENEICRSECEADLADTTFSPDCLECANQLDDLVCSGLDACILTCFPELS